MIKLIGILGSVVALIVGLISVYVFWDDYFKPINQHTIRWAYYRNVAFIPYPGAPDRTTINGGVAPPDENVIAPTLFLSVDSELIGECRIDKTQTPYTVQSYLKRGKNPFRPTPPGPSQLGKRVKKGCSVSSIGTMSVNDSRDPFKVTPYYFECCWTEDNKDVIFRAW